MDDREALKLRLMNWVVAEDQGFMTSGEIAREMGWSVKRTIQRLNELNAAGELEVGKALRLNLAGVICPVPGYRLRRNEEDQDGSEG